MLVKLNMECDIGFNVKKGGHGSMSLSSNGNETTGTVGGGNTTYRFPMVSVDSRCVANLHHRRSSKVYHYILSPNINIRKVMNDPKDPKRVFNITKTNNHNLRLCLLN